MCMGKLYAIGVGNGNYYDLTLRTINILNDVDLIYCDEKMYSSFNEIYDDKKIIGNKYNETSVRCNNAIKSALLGKNVAILGSGDTGIYGIASILLERTSEYIGKVDVEIVPGITYAISGAALLGSPLTQDFAVVTLSDNLAEKGKLVSKLEALAATDLSIVFYSICNPTIQNLIVARNILLKYRSPKTIVGITTAINCQNQEIILSTLQELPFDKVNSYSTLFVGNDKTKILNKKLMVTPLL